MTELLARVRGFFVEVDEASRPRSRRRAAEAPAAVGLVAPARLANPTGAVVALALARARGEPCALLCHWDAVAGGGGPAVPSATRAAAALRARELDGRASGRLARLRLEDDPDAAVAVVAHAAAVVPGAVVFAVNRPRTEAIDRVLAAQDSVAYLEAAEPLVNDLVEESLGTLGRPVLRLPTPSPLARRLAVRGLLAPGAAGVILNAARFLS